MKIQESAENYLEAILQLTEENGSVRSIDIASHLGFSKPSVSIAMKNLKENGYIGVDEMGNISLTEKGTSIASAIYERHNVISDFLIYIGVDKDTALKDACKIEHDLSPSSFDRLKEFSSKLNSHPKQ